MKKGKYKVFVDDNFHCMDVSEGYSSGEYDTYDSARQASIAIIESSLRECCELGMSAEQLYNSYVMFGVDPFIAGPAKPKDNRFSAWDYAKVRSWEIALCP